MYSICQLVMRKCNIGVYSFRIVVPWTLYGLLVSCQCALLMYLAFPKNRILSSRNIGRMYEARPSQATVS